MHAATLGRLDGNVTRESDRARRRDRPRADARERRPRERFADDPRCRGHRELALDAGLAGCSIEDYSGERACYEPALAAERVAAAAQVAHGARVHLVFTARAENHIRGNPDLDDTIARLQAYQAAGPTCSSRPASDLDESAGVTSVDRPVNVLALPNAPGRRARGSRREADLGRRRVRVRRDWRGRSAARRAARKGTYGYWKTVAPGRGGACRSRASYRS